MALNSCKFNSFRECCPRNPARTLGIIFPSRLFFVSSKWDVTNACSLSLTHTRTQLKGSKYASTKQFLIFNRVSSPHPLLVFGAAVEIGSSASRWLHGALSAQHTHTHTEGRGKTDYRGTLVKELQIVQRVNVSARGDRKWRGDKRRWQFVFLSLSVCPGGGERTGNYTRITLHCHHQAVTILGSVLNSLCWTFGTWTHTTQPYSFIVRLSVWLHLARGFLILI